MNHNQNLPRDIDETHLLVYLEHILAETVETVDHTEGNDWAVVTTKEPISGRSAKAYFCHELFELTPNKNQHVNAVLVGHQRVLKKNNKTKITLFGSTTFFSCLIIPVFADLGNLA